MISRVKPSEKIHKVENYRNFSVNSIKGVKSLGRVIANSRIAESWFSGIRGSGKTSATSFSYLYFLVMACLLVHWAQFPQQLVVHSQKNKTSIHTWKNFLLFSWAFGVVKDFFASSRQKSTVYHVCLFSIILWPTITLLTKKDWKIKISKTVLIFWVFLFFFLKNCRFSRRELFADLGSNKKSCHHSFCGRHPMVYSFFFLFGKLCFGTWKLS